MGSSPSSNQNKSRTVDVVSTDTAPALHVARNNDTSSYGSTQFGSHMNMGIDISLNMTSLSDSQQRMIRICLGELETDLGISLNCDELMNCVKVFSII